MKPHSALGWMTPQRYEEEYLKKIKKLSSFHLSLVMREHNMNHIENLVNANITLGLQILEVMSKQNVKYIVNTGTSWQYSQESKIPVNLYAATKNAFEDIISYYVDAHKINAINLLLFDTYGPRDPRKKLFTLLKEAYLNNEKIEMSKGEQLIDLVYIQDVVKAYAIAAKLLMNYEIESNQQFTVSSQKPIPLKELVDTICKTMNIKIKIEWGKRPYWSREVMKPYSKGTNLPGWKPQVSLEEGIKKWWA